MTRNWDTICLLPPGKYNKQFSLHFTHLISPGCSQPQASEAERCFWNTRMRNIFSADWHIALRKQVFHNLFSITSVLGNIMKAKAFPPRKIYKHIPFKNEWMILGRSDSVVQTYYLVKNRHKPTVFFSSASSVFFPMWFWNSLKIKWLDGD